MPDNAFTADELLGQTEEMTFAGALLTNVSRDQSPKARSTCASVVRSKADCSASSMP